jgi:transposase
MKKLTTTMMQETLNKHDGRLTVGLDLGDRSSFYCVLDGTGDVLLEQKVSTTPKAINEIFGAMPRSRIAVETGTHSPWVSRLLSELGHETIVAHARSVRLIGESGGRTIGSTPFTLPRLVPDRSTAVVSSEASQRCRALAQTEFHCTVEGHGC